MSLSLTPFSAISFFWAYALFLSPPQRVRSTTAAEAPMCTHVKRKTDEDYPRVIGLCGYGGSGKDSTGDFLQINHGYKKVAFADGVRKVAIILDSHIPMKDGRYLRYTQVLALYGGYEEAKRLEPSVRDYLVRIGQGLRETISPTVWIDACLPPTKEGLDQKYGEGTRLVVCDVRYKNEGARVNQLGGEVWGIARPGVGSANETEAESVPLVQLDHSIDNDGTMKELGVKVYKRLMPVQGVQ